MLVELVDEILVHDNASIDVNFKFADAYQQVVAYIELNKESVQKPAYISAAFSQHLKKYGAALTFSPAAIDTIRQHFEDFGRRPQDYDLIVTGDLGILGKQIVLEQLQKDGFNLTGRYNDCGAMIFDAERQDVHAGGSGCGCSASVLCGYLLRRMQEGTLRRLLFCATGALLSPVSTWQGESIPGICHAISIVTERR